MKRREETKTGKLLWDFLYNIAGSILYAAGIYTFAGNAGFAPGGVSGLALIMDYLWGLPVGTVTLLLNIPLVIISYRAVGKRLLVKSAVTMVISSLFLDLVFPLFPMYSGDRLIASVCSGAFLGAGMALFYIRGSSSGGIDFLAFAIKKKKPHMTIGVITMLIDLAVILLGWPVFGDVDAVLYGVLTTFVSTVVIDKILYGVGAGTLAVIITGNGKAVAERIGADLEVQAHHDVLDNGEILVEPDVLECPRNAHAADLPCRKPGYVDAIEDDPSAGGPVHARYLVEERGLSRPIGADEACDEALLDMEVHIVDGDNAAEFPGKMLGFKDSHALPPFALPAGRMKKSWSFSRLVLGSP